MKKTLCILLNIFLAVGLASCGAPTATTTPTDSTSQESAVVKFVDPVLEAMVRGAIGKPEGDITAAEAEAVTRLDLSNEWQRYISDGTSIQSINGLESFSNLEILDLSFHAITDVSPLAGLTKLTSLSLGGNPVADVTPLAGLTNLKGLTLSNSAAQDYSSLANLVNLEFLMLDNSSISDISPLASLSNLKYLYLANSPISDYSPLAEVYPNLEKKDFIMASTLEELGFTMDNESKMANFYNDEMSVSINHSKWGAPPMDGYANCVWMSTVLESDYKLEVGYYPDLDTYVFQMGKDGEMLMNNIYTSETAGFSFGIGDRASSEQVLNAALPDTEAEDVLLAPITIFNDMMKTTFNMTAAALYALPFEPTTLKSLGFFPDKTNAVCLYEQRGERDYNIEIHRPEWGEKDYDVRFFTPLSDEYRIVITCEIDKRKCVVGADDNDQGGARFEFYLDTKEHVDDWCSDKELTVEQYFINAYNDPEVEDVYLQSIELMEQYFLDTYGMTYEELYSLPACE